VKNGRLLPGIPGVLFLVMILLLAATVATAAPQAPAKTVLGKLAGIVIDPAGTPQMGASVQLIAEKAGSETVAEMLTNPRGVFTRDQLPPGFYSVRVTLAGFLPSLERHVHVAANLTTVVRIQMESLFASLDRLRRQPAPPTDADDWKWVLRSAAAMRPVLQWVDDDELAALEHPRETSPGRPHARLELTSGSRRPGSVSNLADAPATAFAYDQMLGGRSRLLLAGQMSYERAPAGGIATMWLPTGSLDAGMHTALVLRQAKLGPDGLMFRGVRVEQGGALDLGERVTVHYAAEYVLVGLGAAASALRPRTQVDVRLDDRWRAALIFAAEPGAPVASSTDGDEAEAGAPLQAALNQLDAFPVVLWRSGRPVLEGGWHEELSAERRFGKRTRLQFAGFHDDIRHSAVFGRGGVTGPDFFQDAFSHGFVYDGDSSNSWGARVALRGKLAENLELTAVYAYGGALTLAETAEADLRDALETRYHNSVAVGVSGRVSRLRTHLSAGYKWIDGPVVSRLDAYGDSLYQTDPYFHFRLRQPLPKFGPGRWEALAECQNLFGQGYVTVARAEGNLVLVPALRSFRGGFSVQF
jgi:hypothetical protein